MEKLVITITCYSRTYKIYWSHSKWCGIVQILREHDFVQPHIIASMPMSIMANKMARVRTITQNRYKRIHENGVLFSVSIYFIKLLNEYIVSLVPSA